MGEFGDISINDKWYRIDLESYRGRDIVDFSPRASTPGGSIVHSDLMLYQPLMQTDWRHGFGFPWYEDGAGYMKTEGNVDTRHDGIISMFTSSVASDTDNSPKYGGLTHKGIFYTWGPTGIRRTRVPYSTVWEAVDFVKPTVIDTVASSATVISGEPYTAYVNVTIDEEGENRMLLAFIACETSLTVSSVTYDGIALQQLETAGTTQKMEIWYLSGPHTGSALKLEATFSGTGNVVITGVPVAYVDSVAPFGTDFEAAGSVDGATGGGVTVVGAYGDLVVAGIAVNDGVTCTMGSGQTQLAETAVAEALTLDVTSKTGAASTVMSWTWAGTKAYASVGVALKPAKSTCPVNTLFSNYENLFAVPTNGRILYSAKAHTFVTQPNEMEGADTYISEAATTTNYGNSSSMFVGTTAATKHRSALIKFRELSSLATGFTIKTAKLRLYVKNKAGTTEISIYPLLQAWWEESGATWETCNGLDTWVGSAGAKTSGTDYGATYLYTGAPTTAARDYTYIDLDATQLTAAIAAGNIGFVIHESETTASQYWEFATSSDPNKDWRPRLEITYETTSGEWTNTGVDADAKDFSWFVIHNGKIYAGERQSNRVHYSSSATLADLEGDADDPDKIIVGVGDRPTVGAANFASFLYIAREDGLWTLGDDNIARNVLDYSSSPDPKNFKSMAVHNGYLCFPIGNSLFQWNGSRLTDITPRRINTEFPFITYGDFNNLVSVGNFLYCTAKTNETYWTESILCFDGVGWHKLLDPVVDTSMVSTPSRITMMEYDANWNVLWYHVQGATNTTYYIRFQDNSNYPYAYYPTTGTHAWISSKWDMGFRRVIKSTPSMLVEASGLSITDYLLVYYALDSDDWVLWGKVIKNGFTELTMPGGLHTQEYRHIQIKVEFVTTEATKSPILEGITLRFLMRPEVAWGWNINLPVADNLIYGGFENNKTAHELWEELKLARDSKAPIRFIDIDGAEYYAYITAMTSQALERNVDTEEGLVPSIETIVNLNIVEAR